MMKQIAGQRLTVERAGVGKGTEVPADGKAEVEGGAEVEDGSGQEAEVEAEAEVGSGLASPPVGLKMLIVAHLLGHPSVDKKGRANLAILAM
jgi:hypothetical protein